MKELAFRDQKTIWHPYTQMKVEQLALPIVSAKGSLLFTEDGREIIDCSSSWWTNLHGHSHPFICEQVAKQVATLDHVIFAGFTHAPAVNLAEQLLIELGMEQSKVFYSDNGSTAVEVALKMALQFCASQNRQQAVIIALEDAYHGDTFGAMSASARGSFTAAFRELLFPVEFVSKDTSGLARFKELARGGKPAIFIFEPLIQAASGMQMYHQNILLEMLTIAAESGMVTIADEVFTGFGRSCKAFAMHHLPCSPDIVCLAKGLSGGVLPLGATTCKAAIFDAFYSDDKSKMLFHGHSFTANPIACAAGVASLELLRKPECIAQRELLSQLQGALCIELNHHPHVREARSLGTVSAIELKTSSNARGYFYAQRDFCYNYCLSRGVLVRPLGNVLPIVPPYCVDKREWERVAQVVRDCVTEVSL